MLNHLRAHVARPATPAWNLFKTVAWMVVFWTVFLLILPVFILNLETAFGWSGWRFGGTVWVGAGVVLFALGGGLGITSAVWMAVRGGGTPLPTDCARRLVIVGPYRYVRNPMAIAGLTQAVGVGLILGSPSVIAYAIVGGPIWHVFVRPWEEADLLRRFGEDYRRYRAAVRCWWPSRRYDADSLRQSFVSGTPPDGVPQ
jgi:protein-S-isoprenylcysteine O-methyltransferase Ste14